VERTAGKISQNYGQREAIHVEDLLKDYERYLRERGRSQLTIAEYLRAIKQLAEWYEQTNGESFDPDKVTALDLQEYRAMLDATLKQQPQTINKKIAALKAFWRFAVERGYASINPTDALRRKQTTTERLAPKWLDRKAQSRLLHEVKKESNEKKRARNYAIVQLMLSCGLRVDEVVNLHVNDFDPYRRTITVHAGKGGKFRILPLQEAVADALKKWLELRGENESPYMFLSNWNRPITKRAIQAMVRRYGERAGIGPVHCHQLRHSFCKNLVDAGHPLTTIAQLAGHKSIETTKRYTVPSEHDLRKAMASIEQY